MISGKKRFLYGRFCSVIAVLVTILGADSAQGGEIAVYTQVWRGKAPHNYEKPSGRGYVLIDFENETVTRISSYVTNLGFKQFRSENYTNTVFADYTDRKKGAEAMAIQASRRTEPSTHEWERFLAFRGVKSLLPLGLSQQKQIARTFTGIRRMTESSVYGAGEEDNFTAKFDKELTTDTNANGRTLEAQVELLAASLVEVGWRRTGTE